MAPVLLGFLRLYAHPRDLPPPFDGGSTEVELHNPHTARSVLAVDGAPLGEVAPRGCVVVRGLGAGRHVAAWTTPAGYVRTEVVDVARAPRPTGSSRSCGR